MPNHLPKFPESKRARQSVKLNPKKSSKAIEAKVARIRELMGKETKEIINQANREGLVYLQTQAVVHLRESMSDARIPFRTGRLEAAIVDDKYSRADGIGIRFLIDKLIRHDVPYYAAIEYGDAHSVGRQIPFIFLGTTRGRAAGNAPSATKAEYRYNKKPDVERGSPQKIKGVAHRGVALRSTQFGPRQDGVPAGKVTDRVVGPREIRKLNGSDPNVRAKVRTRGKNAGKITGKGVYVVTITRPVPDYRYAEKARKDFIRTRQYNLALNRLVRASPLDRAGIKYITGR